VNLIGEHTDYNGGLALPFAILEGVTVSATAAPRGGADAAVVSAWAADLGEEDVLPLRDPEPAPGWRAFVRGIVAELDRAGFELVGAHVEISGNVPPGAGLSSSAALEVALALALIELGAEGAAARAERTELARLCSRVENVWVGAHTGLLDQLASLYGEAESALGIDFAGPTVVPVPLHLGAWRLAVLDSGEPHAHSSSGYNERREECARACSLLGVPTLSVADRDAAAALPPPLDRRAAHVLGENGRVRAAAAALRAGELAAIGPLLDESHASLRDLYEASTRALEQAVSRMRAAGASGARMVGGGFGGSVIGLFPPGAAPPPQARVVRPGPGARVRAEPG
jgi:galactokinase